MTIQLATRPDTTAGAAPAPRRRFRLRPKLAIGSAIIGITVLVAIFGPLIAGKNVNLQNADQTAMSPSSSHWLGTTSMGQDVFDQLLSATRGSLEIGLMVGVMAVILSVSVGIIGGYVSGWIDEVLVLFTNIILVIPGLPLTIVIIQFVHSKSFFIIALVLAITSWAASARVLRSQTLSVRNRDYVLAARTVGENPFRIVFVEILPNLLPIIASQFVFAIIFAILGEAGLSFLGLGNINSLTWGSMLYWAQNQSGLTRGMWWWFVPPGLAIAIFGAGLSLINFSIDEVINPQLRTDAKLKRLNHSIRAALKADAKAKVKAAAPSERAAVRKQVKAELAPQLKGLRKVGDSI